MPASQVWPFIADEVRFGARLGAVLAEVPLFPPLTVRMVRIGEETGNLGEISQRIGELYEGKLERGLARLMELAGPVALIVIAVVVGGLIASVMTALLSINQAIN